MKPSTIGKLILVIAVIVAVVAVFIMKNREAGTGAEAAAEAAGNVVAVAETGPQAEPPAATDPVAPPEVAADPLPRLVDLGATTCIPCKKMAPILDQLAEDFAGQLEVLFIDVRKDGEAAAPYRARVIPTQIFIDEEGNELFRHQGFFSREDILTKWAELGYVFCLANEQEGVS